MPPDEPQTEEVPEVDWSSLWAAFAHPDAPSWEDLDSASKGMFKVNWYHVALPLVNQIVWAVERYDLHQKAMRN